MGAHGAAGSSGAFNDSHSHGSAFGHDGSSGAFSNNYNYGDWGRGRHVSYTVINNPPTLGYRNYDHSTPMSPRATWRCLGILCLFGTTIGFTWLLFDLYGSEQLETGLNYSHVLKANRLFVHSISVSNLEQAPGPLLYHFQSKPSLHDEKEWIVEHHVPVPGFHHQEWAFWLNKGSEVNLEYNVSAASDLLIIVAQGKTNFEGWILDPRSQDPCFIWRPVHDIGQIRFQAYSDSDYYIGIGNLNQMSTEIILRIKIKRKLYETEQADSWCSLDAKACTVVLSLTGSDVGLLTTPDKPQEGLDEWHMTVSYNTRWVTSIILYGAFVFVILSICSRKLMARKALNFHPEEVPSNFRHGVVPHYGEVTSVRNLFQYNKSKSRNSEGADQPIEETNDEILCTI